MPQPLKNMIDFQIGTLTVVSRAEGTHDARWLCRCECGRFKVFTGSKLRRGEALCVCNGGHEEHGLSKSARKLYKVWTGMKQRCSDKADARYGGRGIKVCDEWVHSFSSFFDWACSNGWAYGLEIDRRNNDGDYEPANCRFVTPKVNCRNKSNHRVIEFRGESRILAEWADELGIPLKTIGNRIDRLGWSVGRALSTPRRTAAEAARARHSERTMQ